MSGIGGYMPRKDRKYSPVLHYRDDFPLGRYHHAILPSGMVLTWRDEYPLPQTPLTSLSFLSFAEQE